MSDINITVNDEIVNIDIVDEPVLVNVVNSPGVPGAPGQGVPVGGTTGQVLAKNSNTNYDTEWVDVSGGVWGTITGTLSNQTDLQNALNAKVPYTGATANVDLGEYELKAGQVEFDQSPTGTAGVGVMRWNDSDGTVDLGLKGGNVTLQLGQEQVARVVNKSGVNLLESAYQVVKVTDAQGQRLAVDLAQANNDANSADTLGIVTENIDNNLEGFITTSGIVRAINTTGSLQGETWADGDVLYLSPTTAGAITNVKPTAPNHLVTLGYVVYAHANNGKIFVKPNNGYELGELHDVYVPTPSNNDGIFWNSTNLRYENKSVSSALGYTPANAATTLTINGVTYDLSTSRTWSVGSVTGSGASGQVAYWTGTSAQSGSNNLFWDATNLRLGIGTNTPANELSIIGNKAGAITATISNSNTGTGSATSLQIGQTPNSSPYHSLYIANYGSNFVGSGSALANSNSIISGLGSTQGLSLVIEAPTAPLRFFTKPTSSTVEMMRMFGATGNLVIQNGGTFTDSGQRLQVQGTTLLNGNVTFSSATGMFWDATNSRLGIGTNSLTYAITVRRPSDGLIANFGSTFNKGVTITESANGTGLITSHNYDVADPTTGISLGASFGFNGSTSNFYGIGLSAIRSSKYDIWFQTGVANGGGYRFYRGTTELMTLFTTGNLSLNSTTDSGERLQVTGTMKVTGASSFGGNMSISANVIFSSALPYIQMSPSAWGAAFYLQSGVNLLANAAGDYIGFFIPATRGFGFVQGTNPSMVFAPTSYNILVGTSTDVASAIFNVSSTTKGFLPPRMTTTQKNAITSPAAGLVVYDTTDNKHYGYDGTTWNAFY